MGLVPGPSIIFSPSRVSDLLRLIMSLNYTDRQTLLAAVPISPLWEMRDHSELRPSLARSWHLEMKETRSISQSMSVCHLHR